MKQLTQKLELAIYGYDPTVFMPIRYDGELVNKRAFIGYKVKRLANKMLVL